MSAPVAGKFQDHYLVLGIDPKADSSTIQAAYTKLADRYRPGNLETGDAEKFEAVNMAFEVLSDLNLRASFDELKGINKSSGRPMFSGLAAFDALKHGADLRIAVLCILYDHRRIDPYKPSVPLRLLEAMLEATSEELNFALWYLKQRTLVINDDKSSLQISVDGLDYLERNAPDPERVMRLVKADCGGGVSPAAQPKVDRFPSLRRPKTGF